MIASGIGDRAGRTLRWSIRQSLTFAIRSAGDAPMTRTFRSLLLLVALAGASYPVLAQDGTGRPDGATNRSGNRAAVSSTGAGVLSLLPADSTTDHSLIIDGKPFPYKATAGTLSLFGTDGEKSAAVFYTSYVAEHPAPDRPITFVFNGGPGASSAYLLLGLVGPRILDFGPTERDAANARLVDNPQSWLAFTDLVVIDPIGTGWSRTTKPDGAKDFYGVQPDAQVMAKSIALYLAHSGRMSSPKYLLGESYGGYRAVKVAGALQQDQGIVTSGIVMLSPFLEGPLIFGATRFALGAALQFPSLAAAEMEHTHSFSKDGLKSAEQFAMGDFLTTLAGPAPTGTKADEFYGRVAKQTGLPVETVRRTHGFVHDEFIKHLHEDSHDIVSHYDATLTAPDPFPESSSARNDDPVLDGFTRAYGGAFASYARDELGFKTEMTYTLIADDINGKWDWGRGGRSQASATDDLRQLLAINPSYRVMIAQGYSDLVIPYSVSQYIVDHLPDALRDRVVLDLYPGGHMIYTRKASRLAFTADARDFFQPHSFPAPAKD
jgi:carboxypeptidase C (cathepsin A)